MIYYMTLGVLKRHINVTFAPYLLFSYVKITKKIG